MASSKRVSMKGKGAALFFGGASADPSATMSSEDNEDVVSSPPLSPDLDATLLVQDELLTPAKIRPSRTRPAVHRAASNESNLSTPATNTTNDSQPPELDSKHDIYHASDDASMIASYHINVIEKVRKAVKSAGKEVSFVRLTSDEKKQLAEIVFAYKQQGKKTSENEINRIAINFLLVEHKVNGNASILARVIESLLA